MRAWLDICEASFLRLDGESYLEMLADVRLLVLSEIQF